MSDGLALRLRSVGKMYRLYPSRLANLLDAVGLAGLVPRRVGEEFWALRGIDLELRRGQRLGIIGRNGAGKSTLLKLLTGNLSSTEGTVEVKGSVQALLETGAGFHPDFTGHENIRAALTLQGFTGRQIEAAVDGIAEFTELGPFLGQPFKTYSLGMQARLGFATATAIVPDILIVDEVLSAGDAYFTSKCNERMKQLVEGGASVLIVSHALSEIIRYCDEALWIERGRIVKRGPSMDVVTAYEGFIHELDDRRLKARNRKARTATDASFRHDLYSDTLAVDFAVAGPPGTGVDLALIQLLRDGHVEDEVRVGDVQDANPSFSAAVVAKDGGWSAPHRSGHEFWRALVVPGGAAPAASGGVVFYSYGLLDDSGYSLRIRTRARSSPAATLAVAVTKNGVLVQDRAPLPVAGPAWQEVELPLAWPSAAPAELPATAARSRPGETGAEPRPDAEARAGAQAAAPPRAVFHWPGEGSLRIDSVVLLGPEGREQYVFRAGSPLAVTVKVVAGRAGRFGLVPAASLYRRDGIFVSNLVGPTFWSDWTPGDARICRLEVPALNLGDGEYVLSLSIFDEIVCDERRFDLVDRGYELKVVGNEPLAAHAIFRHPGEWVVS